MFTLLHPTESYVSFTSIDGSKHEVWPESGEQFYEGDLLPNGKLPIFIFYIFVRKAELFHRNKILLLEMQRYSKNEHRVAF